MAPAWRAGDADRRARADPAATSDKWTRILRFPLCRGEGVFAGVREQPSPACSAVGRSAHQRPNPAQKQPVQFFFPRGLFTFFLVSGE